MRNTATAGAKTTTSFVDAMDPSRIVQPIEVRGKTILCKVFFRVRGSLSYVGKTLIAAHLFDECDPRNVRVGFVPVEV